MKPSFDLIATRKQGEDVKTYITDLRNALNVKNITLTHKAETSDRIITERDAEIENIQTAMTKRSAEIAAETDAEKKDDLETEQLGDQYRLKKMLKAKGKGNVVNLVTWELGQDLSSAQIGRLDIHEADLDAHIATLPA
ncbi:MAG TPA: hypothetical protein PLJ21_08825 [Pseudobdellovibrionaceae bacterium]|nr:hypothetical protein [Pseudobdellovibrionaceae bacterium]